MTAKEVKKIVEDRHKSFKNWVIENGGNPDEMESFKALEKTEIKILELIDDCANDDLMMQRVLHMTEDMDTIKLAWKTTAPASSSE